MKKLFFIILMITNHIAAQTNCDNEVSTDPDSPRNTALPMLNGVADTRYLNQFDWFPIGKPGTQEAGYYLGYFLSNMNFSGTNIPFMSSIMSAQGTSSEYSYIYNGRMPLTENGWELLLVNVGRFPDDSTPIPAATNDMKAFPYLVLYNRYTGVIRVFCKFGLDKTVFDATDAVEISLVFNSRDVSGLMRLYEGNDQALDIKTDIKKMTSVCKAENFENKWCSTDFQIAYDPCQCFYPSEIQLGFAQIKNASIIAHSRTITLENQDLINNKYMQVNPTDWLSGFTVEGIDVQKGGIAIAKSIDLMVSHYKTELEQYQVELAAINIQNAEVERKLVILNLFETVVLESKNRNYK